MITYDELDAFSKYRCWVYQRADLNRVLMSQAIGPFCDLSQDVTSWNYSEGAAVALEMQEYERERKYCVILNIVHFIFNILDTTRAVNLGGAKKVKFDIFV